MCSAARLFNNGHSNNNVNDSYVAKLVQNLDYAESGGTKKYTNHSEQWEMKLLKAVVLWHIVLDPS